MAVAEVIVFVDGREEFQGSVCGKCDRDVSVIWNTATCCARLLGDDGAATIRPWVLCGSGARSERQSCPVRIATQSPRPVCVSVSSAISLGRC
jgi:hypothetical protein